ncbi:hypothetical protein BH20ACI3_BH20ACI3_09670 [soil metagenome]
MPQKMIRLNCSLVRDMHVLEGFIPPGDCVTTKILRIII